MAIPKKALNLLITDITSAYHRRGGIFMILLCYYTFFHSVNQHKNQSAAFFPEAAKTMGKEVGSP